MRVAGGGNGASAAVVPATPPAAAPSAAATDDELDTDALLLRLKSLELQLEKLKRAAP